MVSRDLRWVHPVPEILLLSFICPLGAISQTQLIFNLSYRTSIYRNICKVEIRVCVHFWILLFSFTIVNICIFKNFFAKCYFSLVTQLCPTLCDPWTVAHQASLSMGFSRWEYWCRLPFPSPVDLPDPGIGPASLCLLHWQAASSPCATYGNVMLHRMNGQNLLNLSLLLSI